MPSNEQVLLDIIAAIEKIPGIGSSRLYIDVKSRAVTVRGRVHDAAQRHDVERAARNVVGLGALVLEVAVSPQSYVKALAHKGATAEEFGRLLS